MIAPEFEEALRLATNEMMAHRYEPSTLELIDWKEITLPAVVFFDDGNY